MRLLIMFLICFILITCSLSKKNKQYGYDSRCGRNKRFVTECKAGCLPTCGRRMEDNCIEECRTGCVCKPGYMYKGYRCVLPSKC
ncbi:hypothetical protein Trydic_g14844 [Trypoxylus dichotomus]